MKLIDITNSHSQLVNEQLANTDAYFIKVYSLGQTTVFYADAATHRDIVILNRKRRIKDVEIEFVVHRLFHMEPEGLDIIHADNFVEISIPVEKKRPVFNKNRQIETADEQNPSAVFLFLKRKKTIYGHLQCTSKVRFSV